MINPFSKPHESSKTTTIAEFSISGMHCTSCALNIDGALEDLPGVVSATTNYARSRTKVEFDETKVTAQLLQQTIEKEGYQVTP